MKNNILVERENGMQDGWAWGVESCQRIGGGGEGAWQQPLCGQNDDALVFSLSLAPFSFCCPLQNPFFPTLPACLSYIVFQLALVGKLLIFFRMWLKKYFCLVNLNVRKLIS